MSYEEKGTWVYVLAIAGAYAAYVVVIGGRIAGSTIGDVSYVAPMLWTMGVAIGLCIVGRVAIEILRPSETYKLDVRDKDINRFGEYVGGSVLSIGMLVPFVLTLASADHFWIANAMYATFALSAVVANATKLVAYRKGL